MVSLWYRIKFFFHRKEELYLFLRKTLGFCPRNIAYYELALKHRSLNERDKSGRAINNERLEFLGDAIIEAVVSDVLFRKFRQAHEGFLTTTRSKIVQRSALNELARKIGLDKMVRYARHSETHNSYMGGNAFEALVGAVYLDQGYERSMRFILRLMKEKHIRVDATVRKQENFKSLLLEWCQRRKLEMRFDTVCCGEDMEKADSCFISTAIVESRPLGKGRGFSKKESQQAAADKSMDMLNHLPQLRRGLHRRRLYRLVITDSLAFLQDFNKPE